MEDDDLRVTGVDCDDVSRILFHITRCLFTCYYFYQDVWSYCRTVPGSVLLIICANLYQISETRTLEISVGAFFFESGKDFIHYEHSTVIGWNIPQLKFCKASLTLQESRQESKPVLRTLRVRLPSCYLC